MKRPEPILVADLFPEVLDSLIGLLSSLSDDDWERPTVCPQWAVKDVATHLLAGEVGILSRQRDGYTPAGNPVESWGDLVALINTLNETWTKAMRRLSPRLLCDLLRHTGAQTCAYFRSLDPFAVGDPVSWAGDEPAPVWLDLAREHTERWHHQQQIRDAVGKPGMMEKRFFAPVLDAFVRALPHTYRNVEAADGTLVTLTITGEAGGRWSVRREGERWALYVGVEGRPHAEIVLEDDLAWRLFTKGVSREAAAARSTISGDRALGETALGMISIIG
jgi:uncharacterized protein (TIGR03083 family)